MSLSLPALVLVTTTLLGGSELPAPMAQMAQKMRQVKSLRASMTQTKVLSILGEKQTAQGTLVFARPRRLHMVLKGSGGTTLIIRGDDMVLHYDALDRTERTKLSKDPRSQAVAEHLFLLLEADPEPLAEVYTIKLIRDAPVTVELRPRPTELARLIERVSVVLDPRGFVQSMTMHEPGGDYTEWTFTEPVLDKPVSDKDFVLRN